MCCPTVRWVWLESTAAAPDGARRTIEGARLPPTVGSGRNIDGRPREVRQRTGWRGRGGGERRGRRAKAKDDGSRGCGGARCVWACSPRRGAGSAGRSRNFSSAEVQPGSAKSRGGFHGAAACRSLALQGVCSNYNYSNWTCRHARQPDAYTIQRRQPDAYSMLKRKKKQAMTSSRQPSRSRSTQRQHRRRSRHAPAAPGGLCSRVPWYT